MAGLPSDAKLRACLRRSTSLGADNHVIRLLGHKIRWGSFHEVTHQWDLNDLARALAACEVYDRLAELNAPKPPK